MNVTIEGTVLEEIFSQAGKNGQEEIIGLLLGSLDEDEMTITDYLTGPSESSRVHASLSRDFLAKIAQKKIDGKLRGHILGWYHSHPDYGAFMSDRDAQTQENIQNLYEDAVALVIDPVREETKLFRMVNGNYIEIPFRVRNGRQKERRENNSPRLPGVRFDAKKIGIILLIGALIASDVGLAILWGRYSRLQEAHADLGDNYKTLYASVDRVMIMTDRFDGRLVEFGRLVTLSTSEQLRKSYCSFLITYLKNFKKMNTTSLDNQFNQKNFNILIMEGGAMLKDSPIVFSDENLITVDIQMKDLSASILSQTDPTILATSSLIVVTYLEDIKNLDVSSLEELHEKGEYKKVVEAGIALNNRRPTLLIGEPTEGEKVSGTFKISWRAFDADGTIVSQHIEYRNIFEASWNTLAENVDVALDSYEWDTSALVDGDYLVRITVEDNSGERVATESGIFGVKNENTPPTLTLLSPQEGDVVKDAADLRWSAHDPDGDILKIRLEYSTNGGTSWKIIAIVANTGSYLWDVSSLPPGTYALKVTVDDSKGGVYSLQISIVVSR